MMTRNHGKQIKFHTLTLENLVPEDHFYEGWIVWLIFPLSMRKPRNTTVIIMDGPVLPR